MAPPELGQPKAPDKVDAKTTNTDTTNEPVPSSSSNTKSATATGSQQDSKMIHGMEEDELKALLEEAITYKRPRDREHKSATFNELLIKTELEDQQQNFSFCTRPSKSNRGSGRHGGHGGSLQDLQEAMQNEYYFAEYSGHSNKKHHSRQKKHTTSVSSRQREGGSLPCNVNESTSATASFLNEVPKRNSKSKNKTDYGTMHVVSAALPSTVDSLSEGNCKKDESQVADGGCKVIRQTETIIDIEETDSDETQHLLAHDSLAQTISDPLCAEEGTELIAGVMKRIPRVNMHQYTAQINIPATSDTKNDIGGPSSTVRPTVQFDKISSIPLLENSSKNVEVTPVQLGSSYNAVKCIVDSKPENSHAKPHHQPVFLSSGKYIAGPGLIPGLTTTNFNHILQNRTDENGNPLPTSAYNSMPSTSSGSATQSSSKSKNRKPKSDRNTVNVDLENIEGYRGKDMDIDSLVCYIENKDQSRKNGTVLKFGGGSNGGSGQKATNVSDSKKKNNNNNNANNESGKNKNKKLKKCNSLEELSSVSRNKDIKEDVDEGNNVETVTLRKPAVKNSVKSNNSSSANSATDNVTVTVNAKLPNANKRGERRSWGTEELNYLGENGNVEVEKEPNNNISSSNSNNGNGNGGSCSKDKIKIKDVSIMNASISTEKKDSLSIVSIENISTGSAETAEFHVVTKKKKAKKKLSQNPFGDDQMQSNSASSSQNQMQSNHNNGKSESVHSSNRRSAANFVKKNDGYMNASENSTSTSRRKSTSSMPPSEKSDSSDLDSVHSLPVENSSSSNSNNKIIVPLPLEPPIIPFVKPSSTISYADIARNAAADKMDKWPSVVANNNNNNNNNNDSQSSALRTLKSSFPELVDHHQNNNNNKNNSVSLNNNSNINNNNNKDSVNISLGTSNTINNNNSALMKDVTYSQSLLAESENSQTNICSSNNNNNNNIIIISNSDKKSAKQLSNSELNNNVSVVNSKLALHKSKSVDNTELNYSIEQYPHLAQSTQQTGSNLAQSTQTGFKINNQSNNSNNNNNIVNSCNSVTPVLTAGKNANNNNNNTSNTNNNTTMPVQNMTTNQTSKKSKTKKDQPQSTTTPETLETINNLKNMTETLDSLNNNIQMIVDPSVEQHHMIAQPIMQTPNVPVHSQSPLSNEATGVLLPGAFQSTMVIDRCQSEQSQPIWEPKVPNQQSTPKVNQSNVQSNPTNVTAKRSKRDRHSLPNSVSSHHSFASNRPAVIILNDSEPKSHEFTFGFDIDQELLFGDFQEDEITMMDSNHLDMQSTNTSTQSDLGYNSLNSNNNQTEIYDHQNRTMVIGKSTESIDMLMTTANESVVQPPPPPAEDCVDMYNNAMNPNNNCNVNNLSLPTQPQVDPPPQTTVIPVPIKKERLKELTLRFIQPTSLGISSFNHEKIVNFVGLAWEDIICGADGGAKYYDGQ